jgi:large subunit ribosomal protein L54
MDFNILKDAPALEEKPDAEYPAWLWTIHNPLPTLFELQKADPETLTERQKTRLFKLVRRKDIKTANNAKAK